MSDKKIIHIGSTVEKAEQGDYTLDVASILKEGWAITKNHKTPIISGLLFVFFIAIIAVSVIASYLGGPENMMADPQANVIANMVLTVIIWPFLAGVEMMGVSHAVGIKTRTGFVFAFLKRSAFIALTAIIVWSLTSLGFALILPGIYIAIALSLTVPLLIEKNMTPIQAIILSFKATRFQWLRLLQIYSALFSLAIMSILPAVMGAPLLISLPIMVVALLLLAPYYYNVKGILYREIFGVSMQVVDNNGRKDTYFSA
ncbi:hypothetical protein [Thalassotalea sp. Y01]|uniref:hypothetical protein n=1 Tax=Thalassotalea sp. Y01 TaxID=2729613 RepID=UPI00145D97B8|nr:hypothetical protein [Thalassotalea sp. Y01]NMP15511.1 hypothetical protein [Thalassotalea sp. Y01]